jgi:C-terminal processing protease CtpA/Prc
VVASFPEAELAPVITSRSDGNLGNEILRRFHVTFDYPRQTMWLVPNSAFDEPYPFSTSGIRPHPQVGADGLLGIDDIYPGSPAAEAGLSTDDRLVAIEGREVATMPVDRIQELLEGQPGDFLALEVARDGKIRQVRFRLRRLI